MPLKITSVTYRRSRCRTILTTGQFPRVKTAGGLGETLYPEIIFVAVGGSSPAGRTAFDHSRRRHFPVARRRHIERTDPAFGANGGRNLVAFLPGYDAMQSAMHPRPAKGGSGRGLGSEPGAPDCRFKGRNGPSFES